MNEVPDTNSAADDIRAGYQSAVDFWVHEGELIWARFNAMLVANTLMVTAIGFLLTGSKTLSFLTIALSFVGFLLCWMWILITQRGFDYFKYWIWSARELEQKLSSGAVKTVSRGAEFAAGKLVTFELDGKKRSFQMSGWSRSGNIQRISLLSPKIFLLIYAVCLLEVARLGAG
jgi:hypothetical protein